MFVLLEVGVVAWAETYGGNGDKMVGVGVVLVLVCMVRVGWKEMIYRF